MISLLHSACCPGLCRSKQSGAAKSSPPQVQALKDSIGEC